jgi:hypothetical protein
MSVAIFLPYRSFKESKVKTPQRSEFPISGPLAPKMEVCEHFAVAEWIRPKAVPGAR